MPPSSFLNIPPTVTPGRPPATGIQRLAEYVETAKKYEWPEQQLTPDGLKAMMRQIDGTRFTVELSKVVERDRAPGSSIANLVKEKAKDVRGCGHVMQGLEVVEWR